MVDDVSEHELRALEERFLEPATRASAAALEALLAGEFREFGASGRIWSRADVLKALPKESPVGACTMSDFNVQPLDERHVLVTYALTIPGPPQRTSLRSSVWRHSDAGWQMLFHQGTPAG
jgi:hypothetical protein